MLNVCVCVDLTISINEFDGTNDALVRSSLTEAFAEVAELDSSLVSLLSVAEITEDTTRRGFLWRRLEDSVKVVFRSEGLVASTLSDSMADTGPSGYAQIVTDKLSLEGIVLGPISVVVSQDSVISAQLAVKSAGTSAVGDTMNTCMVNAYTCKRYLICTLHLQHACHILICPLTCLPQPLHEKSVSQNRRLL